ncbi:MAG: hypothetical protein SGARI_007776 [Bacillariaceae sp.]
MANCSIGDAGLRSLEKNFQLNSAANSHPLRVLNVSQNGLTSLGLQPLTKSSYFSQLRKLFLAQNSFGDNDDDGKESACSQLAAAMRNGPLASLQELDVSQTSCGVEGASALLGCGLKSLTVLSLFGNHLGSDGFIALSRDLEGGV